MAKKKSKKGFKVSKKTLSVVLLLTIIGVSMASLYYVNYLGNHAFDAKGTPTTILYNTQEDQSVKVVSYVQGDPLIVMRRMFTEDEVKTVYLLFTAMPGSVPENSYLVRSVASISEGVGRTKGPIILAREVTPWHKYMMGTKMIGSKTKPVVYMKTPNLGGTENKIVILNEGVVIIENSRFEDTILLSDFLRTVIIGVF
ncbi:MAG: hypothetical protein APG12_01449 [Candidatus Methanofastidiosum methylothiophilum]|uniref:Uncharacterized protein n=1 Tax=Candidatus Methanofastidiosum methylothiophilum TaxID=1705564 RepID=A0A150IWW4_9EURY|nr:MAG: hypothetical protein APG10_01510 [Candidatus Methanofastidiosum methylthiophilus]KYC46798.1 MAG: hypothetical protein APG11_01670 [Candidatus Methanofastidiosum methylthiophilus]KYC49486.1 MAG: hypothetical protein APG12_01449 [Candidatus Methanofastidiosum methylthiophilus]